MNAIGYIRVSTTGQADEGVSLEMQRTKIEQYCTLENLDLIEIIEDAGISAKDIKRRPGFQRALDMVLRGDAHALVVYKLDRAFRSTRDALEVAEAINKRDRALHSITEKLDTTSAIGEFFFTLLASLAQMERRLIGERTAAAMKQKKRNGEFCGGEPPYGWRAQDGRLIEDISEQHTVHQILKLWQYGYSVKKIAKRLEEIGTTNRRGKPFQMTQVSRILHGEESGGTT